MAKLFGTTYAYPKGTKKGIKEAISSTKGSSNKPGIAKYVGTVAGVKKPMYSPKATAMINSMAVKPKGKPLSNIKKDTMLNPVRPKMGSSSSVNMGAILSGLKKHQNKYGKKK